MADRPYTIAWHRVLIMAILFVAGSAAAIEGLLATLSVVDEQNTLATSFLSVLGFNSYGAQYNAAMSVFAGGWSLIGVAASMLWEPRPIQRPRLPIILAVSFPLAAMFFILPMVAWIRFFSGH